MPLWKSCRIGKIDAIVGAVTGGLRERKKLEARSAMSEAALRTALTGGLRAVTAEVVADAVGLSPRTFRNYFSSVEEAVVDGLVVRGTALIDALEARPADEPVWDSLFALVPEHIDRIAGDREDATGLFEMFEASAALRAYQLAAFEEVDLRLADVLAARLGVDRTTDPTPTLVAGVVMVAVKASVELWVRGHGVSLPEVTLDCLRRIRAGLPDRP